MSGFDHSKRSGRRPAAAPFPPGADADPVEEALRRTTWPPRDGGVPADGSTATWAAADGGALEPVGGAAPESERLRERLAPRRLLNGPPPPPPPRPLSPGGGQAAGHSELAARRDALRRRFAEAQLDLGGLTYEMAIRDHFRLDVLVRQAAALQELDAELGTLDYLVALEHGGAAGACPSCGTLYARGAQFCSSCGFQLLDARSVPA